MIPKKIIKFPLKMKNGALVRSLEELRENADLESIMQYYFSGQLTRWCKAFGITDLPEQFECNNEKFVESVLVAFNLNDIIPKSEIVRYVNESFGDKKDTDILEIYITDDKIIKEKLSSIVDSSINLNNYSIEVVPIKDDRGVIQKYRVVIINDKSDQYSRFSVPYELDNEYTHELFEKDLCRKIKYALIYLEQSQKFSRTKATFALLEVGDTFDFGHLGKKKIRWKIIKKDDASIYVVTTDSLCNRKYATRSNDWTNAEIRNWLNGEFYNLSFTSDEKESIIEVNDDNVTLLSKEEAEELLPRHDRCSVSCWWLRTENQFYYDNQSAWNVRVDGTFDKNDIHRGGAIRPALYLKK
ncbi:DUF6273 domain-containing protein [Ruminococcus sp. HUN007]|uniref:DUF6273 domain-containing protein n=1 Tax=Ruminococcus sp. HUN007 TaxID=1514668 RepID=UPI0005D1A179|nr:DUF6273 domain-containing protein [Ruminococcus sp. HUN007]